MPRKYRNSSNFKKQKKAPCPSYAPRFFFLRWIRINQIYFNRCTLFANAQLLMYSVFLRYEHVLHKITNLPLPGLVRSDFFKILVGWNVLWQRLTKKF